MRKAVLVVDDSKFARLTLRSIVAESHPDLRIDEAANGAEALALLEKTKSDFVFIDYNMPGEDGLTVAERIIISHPGARIALVTANVQDAVARKARALGIAFIGKPIDPAAVLAFLR